MINENEFLLREYASKDCDKLLSLFYASVHELAAGDYSPAQLDAWASGSPDREAWQRRFSTTITWVVERNGAPVGFANLDGDLFDCLYTAPGFQGQGVGTLLAGELERCAAARGVACLWVEASKTARPFFEKRGYRLVREQTVCRRGQTLVNYVMEREVGSVV